MHYKHLIMKLDRELQDAAEELRGCELEGGQGACHIENLKNIAVAICYLDKADAIVDKMACEHVAEGKDYNKTPGHMAAMPRPVGM